MHDPQEAIRNYLRKFRYYIPPSVVMLSGSEMSVKWRGLIDYNKAKQNPSTLKKGLYLLCTTGSWFGYYDGSTLHEDLYNPVFSVCEDPRFPIWPAIRDNLTFVTLEPDED